MTHDLHRQIAVDCFNACWEYIENTHRTPDDDEAMRRLAEVSFWAWQQSPACTPKQQAIGYWQLSRVYALSGLGPQALRYAEKSLAVHHRVQLSPFYWGYAYEALARAALTCGDRDACDAALLEAQSYLAQVHDPEERQALEADLRSIQPGRN